MVEFETVSLPTIATPLFVGLIFHYGGLIRRRVPITELVCEKREA